MSDGIEKKHFHDFKITPKDDSQHYTITMDGQEIHGVFWLKIDMGADRVPTVIMEMMVGKVEIEAKDGNLYEWERKCAAD